MSDSYVTIDCPCGGTGVPVITEGKIRPRIKAYHCYGCDFTWGRKDD